MSTHKFALPQPDAINGAAEDGTVAELARVWMTREGPQIIVRPAFDDPKVMGEMLAELCWNFAHAYAQKSGTAGFAMLDQLRKGWDEGHARADAANPRTAQ